MRYDGDPTAARRQLRLRRGLARAAGMAATLGTLALVGGLAACSGTEVSVGTAGPVELAGSAADGPPSSGAGDDISSSWSPTSDPASAAASVTVIDAGPGKSLASSTPTTGRRTAAVAPSGKPHAASTSPARARTSRTALTSTSAAAARSAGQLAASRSAAAKSAAGLLAVGAGATAGGPPLLLGPGTESAAEAEVVRLVNLRRVAVGCPAVAVEPTLVRLARAHSEDMAGAAGFKHNASDGRTPFQRMIDAGYDYSVAAENIAAGQPDAAAVMTAWMASPGHQANILDCRFTQVGVGMVSVPGTPYVVYWTQEFGAPL